MKKIIFTFLCTLSLCCCDSPQQAFELLLNYSKSETSSLRLQYLKDAFVLYLQCTKNP
ncbi:hypothetical protein HH_1107 [Helicobacter hepaticus ATCC 51449]|uniref:Uncharacterized protein n=1 Tax=Helicobacter hepaticus (strain ATCC 51449 / 3B1) TaxID=235279 RepID=Q7VH60_HELHP|nr:hypothetical protein HH_1107 [Helicobacter hepaticus ATCC 51449]